MAIGNEIVAYTRTKLGKREKRPNRGFYDPDFEREMKANGFYVGAPWCAIFGRAMWCAIYKVKFPALWNSIKTLLTPSVARTWNNFVKQRPDLCSQSPAPGALVCWKHGWLSAVGRLITFSGNGHMAVVELYTPGKDFFTTIEGNTNRAGSREGDVVARKDRSLSFKRKRTGLNLIGFIHPPVA